MYETGGRGWTYANQFIDNIDVDLGTGYTKLHEITGEMAKMRADAGYTVIAVLANPGGHGHLATVRPGGKYSHADGPTVSNVGGFIGIESVAKYFGNSNVDSVRYFYQPGQFD